MISLYLKSPNAVITEDSSCHLAKETWLILLSSPDDAWYLTNTHQLTDLHADLQAHEAVPR